jgi:hypothetical protein
MRDAVISIAENIGYGSKFIVLRRLRATNEGHIATLDFDMAHVVTDSTNRHFLTQQHVSPALWHKWSPSEGQMLHSIEYIVAQRLLRVSLTDQRGPQQQERCWERPRVSSKSVDPALISREDIVITGYDILKPHRDAADLVTSIAREVVSAAISRATPATAAVRIPQSHTSLDTCVNDYLEWYSKLRRGKSSDNTATTRVGPGSALPVCFVVQVSGLQTVGTRALNAEAWSDAINLSVRKHLLIRFSIDDCVHETAIYPSVVYLMRSVSDIPVSRKRQREDEDVVETH